MSADYLSNSVADPGSRSWDIYYGTVTANGATAVRDQSTGKTARLVAGQYFILVERRTNNCAGCHNIRAIDAAGGVLPANYGPERYRNH
jgi:mono/diheme cytochrome c family protein